MVALAALFALAQSSPVPPIYQVTHVQAHSKPGEVDASLVDMQRKLAKRKAYGALRVAATHTCSAIERAQVNKVPPCGVYGGAQIRLISGPQGVDVEVRSDRNGSVYYEGKVGTGAVYIQVKASKRTGLDEWIVVAPQSQQGASGQPTPQ